MDDGREIGRKARGGSSVVIAAKQTRFFFFFPPSWSWVLPPLAFEGSFFFVVPPTARPALLRDGVLLVRTYIRRAAGGRSVRPLFCNRRHRLAHATNPARFCKKERAPQQYRGTFVTLRTRVAQEPIEARRRPEGAEHKRELFSRRQPPPLAVFITFFVFVFYFLLFRFFFTIAFCFPAQLVGGFSTLKEALWTSRTSTGPLIRRPLPMMDHRFR